MLSRPKLGVCTWIFGNVPLRKSVPIISKLDYDGVALSCDYETPTAVFPKQILSDHDLRLFSVTPPNVDLSHPDTAVRQRALDAYAKLLDFAAEFGQPLVVVRGMKGRIRPLSSLAKERILLVTAVQQLADKARQRNLKLVFEVLNRYETHLVHTGAEAQAFIADVGRENVGILLGAFHMNIEEQDAPTAIRHAGEKMWLYHMADSNRQAIGRGHTNLGAHLWGLEDIGYNGPLIMECMVPGTDPIAPVHDEVTLKLLETYLQESRRWF